MTDTDQRAFAETIFERNQRRDVEINEALKQENARREAAVKNMYRLRELRLERDQEPKVSKSAYRTSNASFGRIVI
jgi:hypothetical protein